MKKWPSSISRWSTTLLPVAKYVPRVGRISQVGTIRRGTGTGEPGFRVARGYWMFVLILEGSGTYGDVYGTKRKISAGDWIMIFPDVGHSFGPVEGTTWSEFYLCFNGPLFDFWHFHGFLSPRNPSGRFASPKVAWETMKKVLEELTRPLIPQQEALAIWQLFLIRNCTTPGRNEHPEIDPRLDRVCQLIEQSIGADKPDWNAIAREAGIGYDNLRKLFRQQFGTSPSRYRNRLRLENAILLAQSRKLPIKKISEMLGYHDEAHFSRAFHQAKGRSFTAFMKTSPLILPPDQMPNAYQKGQR